MIELFLKALGWVFIVMAFGWATAIVLALVVFVITLPMSTSVGGLVIEVVSIGGGIIAINTQFDNPVITALAIAVVVIGFMLEFAK